MSNQESSMEKNNGEQDDDIYDEEPTKNTMTSQEPPTKSDIHAWRKRNSYAFQRNPLLVRRMSRGEQFKQKKKSLRLIAIVIILFKVSFIVCIVI